MAYLHLIVKARETFNTDDYMYTKSVSVDSAGIATVTYYTDDTLATTATATYDTDDYLIYVVPV